MKIVVLDGYTLNPGDLSWAPLEALGTCAYFDRTPPEQAVERSRGAEILLTNKVVLDRAVLDQLPDVRYIGVTATGFNVVDLAVTRQRGIVVTNVPAYSTNSVAQLAFAHLLNLVSNVEHHALTVDAGRWHKSPDFCYWDRTLVELAGMTFGVVGFGQIGQAVARIARAFGMRVLAHDRYQQQRRHEGVELVELDPLFRESDVVSLHCPLTDEIHHLIDQRRLAMMKPTAYLINTARGPLVDEAALAEALNAGRLAGAGLDVLSVEPPSADNPLLKARNCRITPHLAWGTIAARQRLLDVVVENVRAFLAGKPQNVIA